MIKLSQLAKMLHVDWQGADVTIHGFSTDSRNIQPGDFFIALRGVRFNGHEYLAAVAASGAVAALVSEPVTMTLSTVMVADTSQGLIDLAAAWRRQFHPAIVAITGSCGKTSTRALLQGILSAYRPTLASERSFNNNIGVPLTLLRLRSEHQYAVVEIGANHSGEILPLVRTVQPTVALITNAAASHLEGFGSIEGVARAKSEIYATLQAQDTAIVNQDDFFADYWKGSIKQSQILTFGVNTPADVMAQDIRYHHAAQPSFLLKTPHGEIDIQLTVMGKHNIYNALAAAAAATALNIPLAIIQRGLQGVAAETRRLVLQMGLRRASIIDDSYNANPASVKAAIDVLTQYGGQRVLVLGDMLELGEASAAFHRDIGVAAQQAGIDFLFAYGPLSQSAVEAFGKSGRHFESQQALVAELRPLLNEKMTVLVKGSNAMGMNEVAQSLLRE